MEQEDQEQLEQEPKLKEMINNIKENGYEVVVDTANEAITEFDGNPVAGKEQLAGFIHTIITKLHSKDLTPNEIAEIGHILMDDNKSISQGKYTGNYYPNLYELANDVPNIELSRNPIGQVIGIQEKK